MALIVEDGAGLPNAEAYRSVAGHRTYCAAMGFSLDGLDDTEIEQQARRATAEMTRKWRSKLAGRRASLTQALDWPREEVPNPDAPGRRTYLPSNFIPTEVGDAQSELMLRLQAGLDLSPDQGRAILEETVGPIKTVYDKDSPSVPRITAVEDLLRPFLRNGGSSTTVRLIRG